MSITISGDGDINATGNDIELNSTGTTDVTLAVGGGSVGVGTATPTKLLDVNGSVAVTDITASSGIYLGGTGSSNLLQDYEEGSFTPVMRDTSETGTIIGSTVTRATYTKIGRWVNCILDITRNDSASLTGNLFVTGLPFTGAAGKSLSSGAWFDGSSTDYIAVVYKRTSDTVALFRDVVAPSSAPYVTSNEWQNGRPLITSILYEAA